MPILRHGDELGFCRLLIRLDEFPDLLRQHRKAWPDTPAIEKLGAALIAGGFGHAEVEEFVRRVCRWGDYAGVAGRVIKRNGVRTIAAALREASDLTQAGRPADSVARLTRLRDLGISFASKHLKFLAPERAVVLDSVIGGRLGYLSTPAGYAELLADCIDLRDRLLSASVPFPFPDEGPWRVSDVEMAIFMKLRS